MPERQTLPEASHERAGFREIESKIREVNLAALETNLHLAGAKLTIPERLIIDKLYKFPKNPEQVKTDLALEAISPEHLEEFLQAIRELGLEVVVQENLKFIEVDGKLNNPDASIRVRIDGDKGFFTVKTDAGTTDKIKKKNELDPEILDVEAVRDFLKQVGYRKDGERQKNRATYELDYNGVKVKIDLNISPDKRVKPWIEIEAPDDKYLIKTAQLLGYNNEDLYPGSDKQLYLAAGLTREEIKQLKFNEL